MQAFRIVSLDPLNICAYAGALRSGGAAVSSKLNLNTGYLSFIAL